MNNQIQKSGFDAALTDEDIKILAQAGVIPANTPAAQVKLFAITAQQHGLSPFKKEIYLVAYGGKYAAIVGIDGFRVKAQRTGQYAGVDDAQFNRQSNGTYQTAADLKAAGKTPLTCTITVYRVISGQRCPFTHTAVFSEFAGTGKWQTMPFQMIQKVAEAFALKKAFGDELSGLHIDEEMAAFENTTIEVKQPPKVLETLDSSHPKWGIVVDYLATKKTDIKTVKDRYFLSEANETKLLNEAEEVAANIEQQ